MDVETGGGMRSGSPQYLETIVPRAVRNKIERRVGRLMDRPPDER